MLVKKTLPVGVKVNNFPYFQVLRWVDAKDGPYAYKGDQWVGYDTKKSAVAKVNYMAK